MLVLVTAQLARKYCVLPIHADDKSTTVVMAEPRNFRAIEELRFKSGLKIEPRLGLHAEISTAIDRVFSSFPSADANAASLGPETLGMEFISSTAQERNVQAMREMQAELQQKSKTTPAVHLVASIIRAAAAKRSRKCNASSRLLHYGAPTLAGRALANWRRSSFFAHSAGNAVVRTSRRKRDPQPNLTNALRPCP